MNDKPKTAIILVAGRGTRLNELTDHKPKCLVEVNKISILERTLANLIDFGIDYCIIVLGYKGEVIQKACAAYSNQLNFKFVWNRHWDKTNNIVSLQIALPFIESHFLLLEGDLLFSKNALNLLSSLNSMAVDDFKPFMDGTVVSVKEDLTVDKIILKSTSKPSDCLAPLLKTVNIYSFNLLDFKQNIEPELNSLVVSGHTNVYYELAFARSVEKRNFTFKAVHFGQVKWAEIDDQKDLFYAKRLFTGKEAMFEPKFSL